MLQSPARDLKCDTSTVEFEIGFSLEFSVVLFLRPAFYAH